MVTLSVAVDEDAPHYRAVPGWWSDARFGVMITWGAYAVPAYAPPVASFQGYAEWYEFFRQIDPDEYARVFPEEPPLPHRAVHAERYGNDVTYDDLVARWRAERWDPARWIEVIEDAGAGYAVLVAKHHDGVALWPTSTSDRHTVAMGPHRDIVGEFMDAARATSVRPGLFYAMAEWFNPAPRRGIPADPAEPLFDLAFNRHRTPRDPTTGAVLTYAGYLPIADETRDHVVPQIMELIERYVPSILWFDLPADPTVVDAPALHASFRDVASRVHPEGVVVNDLAARGVSGDFAVVGRDFARDRGGAFEVCRSTATSFGYNADSPGRATAAEIVTDLVDAVSAGGNLILNIGPHADGTIDPADRALLVEIGRWMRANGAAIRASRPWPDAPIEGVRFTVGRDGAVYAFIPPSGESDLPVQLGAGAAVRRLSDDAEVAWESMGGGIRLHTPAVREGVVPGTPIAVRLGQASEVRRARP